MKKNNLLSDSGGKCIAIFQDTGLQVVDVLTSQMVHHRKMQAPSLGMMPGTIERGHPAVNNIFIRVCPLVEYPVYRKSHVIVGMAIADQLIRMLFQVLSNYRHNHTPHFLVWPTTTLPTGKPKQEVEYAMVAYFRHLDKVKHVKTTRGIIKLHRRIASFP